MTLLAALLALALCASLVYIVRLRRRLVAEATLVAKHRETVNLHASTAEMHADMRFRETRMADAIEINRQKYTQQRSLVNRMLATNMTAAMRENAKRVFNEAMDLLTLPAIPGATQPPAPAEQPSDAA